MLMMSRRRLLRGSLGVLAAGTLARPFVAKARATTANCWWVQGFIPEEDAAFRTMVADYEKASGNKIEYTIVPFAAMREKEISAVQTGVVPDMINAGDFYFVLLSAWKGQLLDVSDVVETQKSRFSPAILNGVDAYDGVAKRRAYHAVPSKATVVPIHIWKSLVEKGGGKVADIPKKWDTFLDYFKPVQDGLRKAGMRSVYAYGYQLTANGVDPNNLFAIFLMAYGGTGIVTPDGQLHTADPKVKEAAVKAVTKLTAAYKEGYVPPGVTNWNDADDNNAFHSKLMVMDFDGTLSTEVALYHDKAQYDDILTMALPLDDVGKQIPSQLLQSVVVIPKGAKNVAVAKEFLKYTIEPKVMNTYLKGGLGRWLPTMPEIAKSDPFWLKEDPHRAAYTWQGLINPTIAPYETFNPAWADVNTQHVIEVAEFAIMNNGMAPEQAVDKALKRIETVFEKYPIHIS